MVPTEQFEEYFEECLEYERWTQQHQQQKEEEEEEEAPQEERQSRCVDNEEVDVVLGGVYDMYGTEHRGVGVSDGVGSRAYASVGRVLAAVWVEYHGIVALCDVDAMGGKDFYCLVLQQLQLS